MNQDIEIQIFQGWNPPEPLLDPQNWPVPSADQPVLVSIDFYSVVGGPYRAAVDRWLKNGWPVLWQVTEGLDQSDVLIDAVSRAVENIQTLAIDADTLEIETISRVAEWGVWARVILPDTFLFLGETQFSEILQRFRVDLPQVVELPWLSLGYLAGFVRQSVQKQSWDYKPVEVSTEIAEQMKDFNSVSERADFLSEMIAVEWARYQALYSPQNESKESESLSGTQLMINPAAQILPLRQRDEIRVIVRRRRPQWSLYESKLHWMGAMLVDELSENSRLSRADLLNHVTKENPISRSSTGLTINGLTLQESESFESHLDNLIENGLILVQVN